MEERKERAMEKQKKGGRRSGKRVIGVMGKREGKTLCQRMGEK